MNKVVQLVNEWAAFERDHPEAEIEDFCRYYLLSQREQRSQEHIAGGIIPPDSSAYLLKLMGRIVGIFSLYTRNALEEIGLPQRESFPFLNSLKHLGESRKSELIAYNLYELSTGIDILNRMKKAGLISERSNPNDRRSMLVKITPKGEKLLYRCYELMNKASTLMLHDLTENDRKLCIQLLKGVEIKHAKYCVEAKGKTLDEMYDEIVNDTQQQPEPCQK